MKKQISHRILGVIVVGMALFAVIAAIYGNHQAASIGIIGGADGPTAIFVAGEPKATAFFGVAAAIIIVLITGSVFMLRKRG